MQDQGNADCLKGLAGKLGSVFRCRRWHLVSEHVRKAYAGLLEYSCARQHATLTTAASRALPRVALKSGGSVKQFNLRAKVILQFLQIRFDLIDVAQFLILIVSAAAARRR
jgi:hypothetical protein